MGERKSSNSPVETAWYQPVRCAMVARSAVVSASSMVQTSLGASVVAVFGSISSRALQNAIGSFAHAFICAWSVYFGSLDSYSL